MCIAQRKWKRDEEMRIGFDAAREVSITHLKGGEGTVTAKMHMDPHNKIMLSRLPAGTSIGMHRHTTSSEINYVLSGAGKALCDGVEEDLTAGVCHYCPKGSAHSIVNTGSEDLVLFTVVPEQ